jgi:hypothetical protein
VVLFFGGSGDPAPNYSIGGFQIAPDAVEQMRSQYSSELGSGRGAFVTLRTGGVPDTIPRCDGRRRGAGAQPERSEADRAGGDAQGHRWSGGVRRSDKARTMTPATVNVSAAALSESARRDVAG